MARAVEQLARCLTKQAKVKSWSKYNNHATQHKGLKCVTWCNCFKPIFRLYYKLFWQFNVLWLQTIMIATSFKICKGSYSDIHRSSSQCPNNYLCKLSTTATMTLKSYISFKMLLQSSYTKIHFSALTSHHPPPPHSLLAL